MFNALLNYEIKSFILLYRESETPFAFYYAL